MLKTDPISLFDNIRDSERLRDSVVQASEQIVREYHGSYYRQGRDPAEPAPENHWFEWLNTIKPQVVYDNPKVRVRSRRSGPHKIAAMAMEAGLNAWTPAVGLWRTLSRIFDDSAFSYGVARIGYEPAGGADPADAGTGAVPYRPVVRRVDPGRWFCDHAADFYDPVNGQGRYAGHVWWRDKDDLLADPRYNLQAVEKLVADADLKKRDRNYGKTPTDRNEIIGYELWVPEIQTSDDPNAHGTLFTLASARNESGDMVEPEWIRDPRPFFGPRTGPYVMFGYHFVPNCPYPLSPFAAVYEQIRELNAHATSAARSAANSKRIGVVDALNQDAADILADTPDGQIAVVQGGNKEKIVETLDLGGVRKEAYEYLDRLYDRRDRVTGLSEAARGNVDKDATATAIADAAAMRNTRTAMLHRLFTEGTQSVLQAAGFYLFHMTDAVYPLNQELANLFVPRPKYLPPEEDAEDLAQEMGLPLETVRGALEWSPEVLFAGGPAEKPLSEVTGDDGNAIYLISPHVGGLMYDDLELEIEPYSMQRIDEAVLQRNTQRVVDLLPRLLQAAAQHPEMKLEELVDMLGQSINMPDLSERVLDTEMLNARKQMARAATASMQMGAVQGDVPGPDGLAAPLQGGPALDARQQGMAAGQASMAV